MKRYFYVIALRNNSNAVSDCNSNYRLASGQVRADTLDDAFSAACKLESVSLAVDDRYTFKPRLDYFRKGQRVSLYVTPMSDDQPQRNDTTWTPTSID